MDIATNREIIWERIKAGGPTSIVVSNKEEFVSAVPSLLDEFKKELLSNHIIPLRVDCEIITNPIDFFKKVFFSIWDLLTPEDKEWANMFKEDIELTEETSTIDAILENFLPMVKNDMHLDVLLILENFDTPVAYFEEPDLMKIRGMSSNINMLTITLKSLETLAKESEKDDYFCNQFNV